jgi:hypothetical protein
MLGYAVLNNEDGEFALTFDGEIVSDRRDVDYYIDYFDKANEMSVAINSPNLCKIVLPEMCSDLLEVFKQVEISNYENLALQKFGLYMSITITDFTLSMKHQTKYRIEFDFSFDISSWKNPWTMSEQADEFLNIFGSHDIADTVFGYDEDLIPTGYNVSFPIENKLDTFESLIARFLPIIEHDHNQTVINLQTKVHPHTITIPFAFPPEVRVACEQYLVYFVQFLADVGIEATADLQEKAGGVLFSVTPKDKDEALEHIREALAIYLRLPASPGLQTVALSTDLEAI